MAQAEDSVCNQLISYQNCVSSAFSTIGDTLKFHIKQRTQTHYDQFQHRIMLSIGSFNNIIQCEIGTVTSIFYCHIQLFFMFK